MEAPTSATQNDEPKRIDLVDGLRGFALLGIMIVNIVYFATAYTFDLGLDNPRSETWLDGATEFVTHLLFGSKFYILFAFLFGYSFVLQMQSAERQGKKFTARMWRRLIGLFVLGSLHAVFLWHGDILTLYAVLGVLLLAMREIKPHVALIVGAVITFFYSMLWALMAIFVAIDSEATDDTAEFSQDAASATVAFRGSFGDVLEQRLTELPDYLGGIYFVQGPLAFSMFLFGLAAAKSGLFSDLQRFRPLFWRMLRIGLPIGLIGSTCFALAADTDVDNPVAWLAVAALFTTAPFLTSAYVATFALASATRLGRAAITTLAPVGRMALSNYILQSVIMGLIFFGYGFGLFGEVGPFTVLMIALAIFATQIVVSVAWLSRHAYGPLEWLLRGFTYWQRPAWRKPLALEQPALDSLVGHPPNPDVDPDRRDP